MNAIRKSTWTIMILGAAAGCAGDEPGRGCRPRQATGVPPATVAANATLVRHGPPAPPIRQERPDGNRPMSHRPVEGPKTENTKPNTGAAKLTRRRARRDQGVAGSRTGSGDSARPSAR